MKEYTVIMENIGTVYDGDSKDMAISEFNSCVDWSKSSTGKASGEAVYLLDGVTEIKAYEGEA